MVGADGMIGLWSMPHVQAWHEANMGEFPKMGMINLNLKKHASYHPDKHIYN